MSLNELRAKRATALDACKAFGLKADFDPAKDTAEYDRLKAQFGAVDAEIKRAEEIEEFERKSAQPVAGQDADAHRAFAQAKDDPYTNEAHAAANPSIRTSKGMLLAGCAKMIGVGGGNIYNARQAAKDIYGERHPVTKALLAGVGASGGFFVPPDQVAEYIEILRPMTVVRSSNPRVLPMPRGTMRLPSQTSAATASYGAEDVRIGTTQQTVGAIIATFKKLRGLVPISNDLMRYADPAIDAFVRDDLVKVMALREDLAFLTGDGTQDSPRGYLSFANASAVANGGSAGVWLSTANSTLASGGNFITANETFTLATAASEFGGAINKLDTANVPDIRRKWFWHPRTFNYLYNVQNSLGLYVYRDELEKGRFLGYPFGKSTQIPINLYDVSGGNTDCSFVFLVEMTEDMLFDSMSLELAVSREGTYVDANSVTQSAFANDETLIRAIAEHDHQMRHDVSVAVIQNARYQPAIS
jgi:HK97 family phage major capsid protein